MLFDGAQGTAVVLQFFEHSADGPARTQLHDLVNPSRV